jgi:hypothetical protein
MILFVECREELLLRLLVLNKDPPSPRAKSSTTTKPRAASRRPGRNLFEESGRRLAGYLSRPALIVGSVREPKRS